MARRFVYTKPGVAYALGGAAPTIEDFSFTTAQAGDAFYTAISAAAAAMVAGDPILVAHDHEETQTITANTNVAFASSLLLPLMVLCVDRSTGAPATTAKWNVVTSPAASNFSFTTTATGAGLFYGIDLSTTGTGSTALQILTANSRTIWKRSKFRLLATASGARIGDNNSTSSTSGQLLDCQLFFSNSGQGLAIGSQNEILIENQEVPIAAPGTTLINNLFPGQGTRHSRVTISGADLRSLLTPTGSLNNTSFVGYVEFINPTLSPGNVVSTLNTSWYGAALDLIGYDFGGGNARHAHYRSAGNMQSDHIIYRRGGASDGRSPFSWRFTTVAACNYVNRLDTLQGDFWVDEPGVPITATFEVLTDGLTLKADELWAEIAFPNDPASSSYGSASSQAGPMDRLNGTAAALAASTAVWDGNGGMAVPTKQKIVLTFTPVRSGLCRWQMQLARASTSNIYVDPKPQLS